MRSTRALVVLILACTAPLAAQSLDSLSLRFAAFTTVSGFEWAVGDSLLTLFPGATRDRLGNVTVTLGSGAPRRLVACPMDETGYAVGGITSDGFLTLHRDGRPSVTHFSDGSRVVNPLFDQQLEGQRVTVFGASGPIPGVVGVRSVHLTRGRPTSDAPFTADDAYVDIGATSAAEVASLGVRMLSPVALAKRPIRYGDGLAAPGVGRHAACAALAAALLTHPKFTGSVVATFMAQTLQGYQGGAPRLASALPDGPFAETMVPSVPVKYAETAAETVMMTDVRGLEERLVKWIGGAK